MAQVKGIYDIRLWYLFIVSWHYIRTSFSCPSGTFKSDFLSGGCTPCPNNLEYCKNEEYNDSIRCFKACRKLFTTKAPITSPTIPVLVTKPTTTPRPITKWLITKHWTITDFEKFKKTLVLSTPTVLSNNSNNSNGNSIGVILGLLIAVLICVLIGIFMSWFIWQLYQKNKRSSQQEPRPPSPYSAVDQSNSSIDDDIQEDAIPEDSVSRENFNNLTETTL